MNNKASIANLLNDNNHISTSSTSSSSYELQNSTNATSLNKKPSRFITTEDLSQHALSNNNINNNINNSTTTRLMEYPNIQPRPSDTTIVNGVQIVANGDLSFNQPFPQQFTGNWLTPLHPLYTYDPPPAIYRKSKRRSQKKNIDLEESPSTSSENSPTIRTKRNYTKKPLDRLKRPRNGYMIYMNEVYDDVKRKHPNLKFGELSSLIGVKWKEMSKAEQMPYHQKHEEEKAAYEAAKLAMSRTNLQIVEETIDIEQQVKAAELRASQPKNKSNSKRTSNGDQSIEGKQKSVNRQQNHDQTKHSNNNQDSKSKDINKFNNNNNSSYNVPFVIPNAEPPETISTYIVTDRSKTNKLRHGIPITPTSPDFNDITNKLATPVENVTRRRTTFIQSSRESQRDEYFKKHFPDLKENGIKSNNCDDDTSDECKESFIGPDNVTISKSAEKNISIPMYSNKMNQFNTLLPPYKDDDINSFTDYEDEEEEIDQLQPSDRSDSEMEGVEIFSKSSSMSKSNSSMELESQENAKNNSISIDTSNIWHVPIEGTTVSPGLTPHRKRKIIIIESDEENCDTKIINVDNLKKCRNNKV